MPYDLDIMVLSSALKPILKPTVRYIVCLGLLTVSSLITGCQPRDNQANAEGPFLATNMGYVRAPEILTVAIGKNGIVRISGIARPDGRVRLISGQGQAFGVTANTRGEFEADLPGNAQGSLYDVSMEESGRLMKAEGRLFVPPAQPERAVFMRSGSPSLPLSPHAPLLAVVDYDSRGGVAVAGRAKAGSLVSLAVNGSDIARVKADDTGLYHTILPLRQSLVGQTVTLEARSEGAIDNRQVDIVSTEVATDRVLQTGNAWRVDWSLPGGGAQTTIVY
ncbi:hypothetical protein [Asticcacaulis machinosus]|uniref:Uncharacterized protein n=1 Tax=Asticcacaulis machinosus TaxID=2984211 RepID=A0ABT5HFG9_9CAUL|nr:hypothetical protein [Asticcacaulis machinosus]MDC7674998.1 hypothetical protein [Asticcacaulis machinosus]